MWKVNKQKNNLKIIFFIFILSFVFIIITTPLHEVGHWILSDIDPYIEPVELHIFDKKSFQNGENIFSSAFGYVLVKEEYPGAFNDRPLWSDLLQELICIFIQLLLTCLIISIILKFIIYKNLDTTHQSN